MNKSKITSKVLKEPLANKKQHLDRSRYDLTDLFRFKVIIREMLNKSQLE